MSDTRVLDRLIRVRRVRARLALAALGRSQARHGAETALLARVAACSARAQARPARSRQVPARRG